jgi:hypothetical protein
LSVIIIFYLKSLLRFTLNFFKRNKFQNSKESLLIQPYAANASDISTIEFVITHSNPATIKMTIEL